MLQLSLINPLSLAVLMISGSMLVLCIIVLYLTREYYRKPWQFSLLKSSTEEDKAVKLFHLQTKLTAINWNIDMILSGDVSNLSAEQTEWFQKIQEAGRESNQILQSLGTPTRAKEKE